MPSTQLIPNIVVPMAGMGSRFVNAGYTDIKPLIPIFNKPMIEHVINSVNIDGNWIFIVQKGHREKYNLDEILTKLRPNCIIIDTGYSPTEGAACSVLLAKQCINTHSPLIVLNSDNIIKWDSKLYFVDMYRATVDGLILCFKDTDPKWSFVKLDAEEKYITEVAEKHPISDNATAGMYIWKRGIDFVRAAEQMISKNIKVNNEFYLCPVYNENIKMGQKIIVGFVDEMHGVGTPEDLEYYITQNR